MPVYRAYLCSQTWLPTVQDVLHADWQEAGHSPHPPVRNVLFNIALLTVLMCFFISSPSSANCDILLYPVFLQYARPFIIFTWYVQSVAK